MSKGSKTNERRALDRLYPQRPVNRAFQALPHPTHPGYAAAVRRWTELSDVMHAHDDELDAS